MRNTTHPFELILEKNRRKYRFTLLFPSVVCNKRLHLGILPLVLIPWVAAEVAQDLWWLSSFPGIWYKPPLWISSLTKDLLEAADAGFCDAALLHWRGATQLNSSSVFLLLYCRLCVDKSWVFALCCLAYSRGWYIVCCHSSMLCLLLSGRERGEADEEIMRDGGKWTDHMSDTIIKMILFLVFSQRSSCIMCGHWKDNKMHRGWQRRAWWQ